MGSQPLSLAELGRLLDATAAELGRPSDGISVSFVDESTIQRLNREHRGKDVPTDVLSFPFASDFPHGTDGEVLVCETVARRNAAERGIDPRAELAMLVIHGALHVYGMEDQTAAGAAAMERRTQAILKAAWSETSE